MDGASTFFEGYARALEKRWDDPLYTFLPDGLGTGETWRYRDLHVRASGVAERLLEAVSPGDRVILMAPPGLDYLAGFFGCLYAGVIAVPAYPPSNFHDRDNINRLLAIAIDAGATTGLVTREILAELLGFSFGDVSVTWVTIDDEQEVSGDGTRAAPRGSHLREASPDDVAFLQYTSGSTGHPKGVVVTQGSLAANVAMIQRTYRLTSSDQGLSWLPPYHDMGLIGLALAPAWVGVHVTFMPPAVFLRRPVRWLQAMSRLGATASAAPNFAFESCVNKVTDEELEELDLSLWRVAINGAEPVRAATVERFARRFGPCGFRESTFHPAFGMAEATLLASSGSLGVDATYVDADEESLRQHRVRRAASGTDSVRLVTCGRAPDGSRIEIVDPESGQPLEEGVIGEIVLTGPHIAAGYWTEASESGTRFESGRLATGDLGALVDGQLVVTGRIKDLIILRGRNYYPQDIERSAEAAHPALRRGNAAAFTVDDGGADEQLVVVLEARPAALEEPSEVLDGVRRAIISSHGVSASAIVLVGPGQVPKTSSGKIRRSETRQRHLAGRLEPVAAWFR